jgi:hypothetical protein
VATQAAAAAHDGCTSSVYCEASHDRRHRYIFPLMSDEEPETWDVLVARDLKTDRVSANHQRMISYAYTNTAFIPPAILPGFAFHQTDRSARRDSPSRGTVGNGALARSRVHA